MKVHETRRLFPSEDDILIHIWLLKRKGGNVS